MGKVPWIEIAYASLLWRQESYIMVTYLYRLFSSVVNMSRRTPY